MTKHEKETIKNIMKGMSDEEQEIALMTLIDEIIGDAITYSLELPNGVSLIIHR